MYLNASRSEGLPAHSCPLAAFAENPYGFGLHPGDPMRAEHREFIVASTLSNAISDGTQRFREISSHSTSKAFTLISQVLVQTAEAGHIRGQLAVWREQTGC